MNDSISTKSHRTIALPVPCLLGRLMSALGQKRTNAVRLRCPLSANGGHLRNHLHQTERPPRGGLSQFYVGRFKRPLFVLFVFFASRADHLGGKIQRQQHAGAFDRVLRALQI